jgi:uncharacterized protein involved in exopolysaccharide biosynthesis
MSQTPSTVRPVILGQAQMDEWRSTFAIFGEGLKRWVWAIVACALLTSAAATAYKYYSPVKYPSTSQLLFDPRGLRIFNNDLSTGYFDANAAINYVESQMGVLKSERVLSRVFDEECSNLRAAAKEKGDQVYRAPNNAFTRFCPREGWDGDWLRGIQEILNVLSVKRVERSFVVDVTTSAPQPELAAHLTKAVIAAYLQEDASNRAETVGKLTGDLSGRLEALRASLQESEAKVDTYRRDKNLVRVGDKLLVEQRLSAAIAALNDGQSKIDRATARLAQIEAAANSPSALGALAAEADTRPLLALSERRSALMTELAPLFARAGALHPAMIDARARIAEIDRAIGHEMAMIRAAARADVSRLRNEVENQTKTISSLTETVAEAKRSEIELRALEQQVEANRKVLESFETRSREAREFGRVDSANLRVVSVARAWQPQKLMPRLMMFAMLGLVFGTVLAIVGVAFWALVQGMRRQKPEAMDRTANPAFALQMRAQAFARYRYG